MFNIRLNIMASKDTVWHLIIILHLVLADISTGEQAKPCSANSENLSQVSFTQYIKVSESEWSEYYKNIQKNSDSKIKILPGYISITYSYAIHHPSKTTTGCKCKEGTDPCLEDAVKTPTDEIEKNITVQTCGENREGVNCERCKENFFNNSNGLCTPCQCNETGSLTAQCDLNGKCQCKPGVTGDTCDLCEANSHNFGPQGCQNCTCNNAGTKSKNGCDSLTGSCNCKSYVEGYDCDTCAPGHFNLDQNNEFGCTPCFCFGHSTVCSSAFDFGQSIQK